MCIDIYLLIYISCEKNKKIKYRLTDDVARENYRKYGHPDGKQGNNLLNQWIVSQ